MFTAIFRKPYYCLTTLLLCWLGNAAFAGETTRVSVSSTGEQGNNYSYGIPSISADVRYVVFCSNASNLITGDTNGYRDIFVHDRQTKQTTRVSIASNGEQGNGVSCGASTSADGRYVAFTSSASNLVAGNTKNIQDIFVHDRQTHQTTQVSVSSGGRQGNANSWGPSISADGRYVTFTSWASNLVVGDTNNLLDVFVHDRQTHQTTRANVASDGMQANDWSYASPSISADGRYVAFESKASNLVAGDSNGTYDIFVHDRLMHQTTRVSVSSDREQGNRWSYQPNISADGRYVAFASSASNLVVGDTDLTYDVFVHDRLMHQTTMVSVDSGGVQSDNWSESPSLSADGRYVAFFSYTTNPNIFVHDRLTHQTTPVSSAANYGSVILSTDGRYVAFLSGASNLVVGDTNHADDIFIRDRKLLKTYQTDLQIAAILQPASLVRNSEGTYQYTITNNGPDVVKSVRIVHSVSNGRVARFQPDQGKCQRYATVSLCELGNLLPGNSMKLEVIVKALHNPLSQQISVSPNAIKDTVPDNNSVNIETPVTP